MPASLVSEQAVPFSVADSVVNERECVQETESAVPVSTQASGNREWKRECKKEFEILEQRDVLPCSYLFRGQEGHLK